MSLYEAAKDAISIAQKADNVELLRQIIDLQKAMQDMQQENLELKRKNEELQAIIKKDKSMKYDHEESCYYEHLQDGNKEGPYCPICWEKDRIGIHLEPDSGSYKWYCKSCKNVMGKKKNFYSQSSDAPEIRII